jgi:hypothetical protein
VRMRAVRALEVYQDVRRDFPIQSILAEESVHQVSPAVLKDFLGNVGLALVRLPRAQRRAVLEWVGRIDWRRPPDVPEPLLMPLAQLEAVLDGETDDAYWAALRFALVEIGAGMSPAAALAAANHGRRVRVPG